MVCDEGRDALLVMRNDEELSSLRDEDSGKGEASWFSGTGRDENVKGARTMQTIGI